MAALTGLLGDYGSDDESAASGQEVAGPPIHSPYNLMLFFLNSFTRAILTMTPYCRLY